MFRHPLTNEDFRKLLMTPRGPSSSYSATISQAQREWVPSCCLVQPPLTVSLVSVWLCVCVCVWLCICECVCVFIVCVCVRARAHICLHRLGIMFECFKLALETYLRTNCIWLFSQSRKARRRWGRGCCNKEKEKEKVCPPCPLCICLSLSVCLSASLSPLRHLFGAYSLWVSLSLFLSQFNSCFNFIFLHYMCPLKSNCNVIVFFFKSVSLLCL